MNRHYHIGHNMPGYLPESGVDTATTITDRRALMVSRAGWFRDDMEGAYLVEGNRDDGYWVTYRDDPESAWSLVIWWMECYENKCEVSS